MPNMDTYCSTLVADWGFARSTRTESSCIVASYAEHDNFIIVLRGKDERRIDCIVFKYT